MAQADNPEAEAVWLDLEHEQLWRGAQALHLRPKSFALLCYLVAQPGRASARPQWSTPLWRSWWVLPTCGWREGSVSSPTAPAKPTCRSSTPWGSSVAGRTASDWWPGWHSTLQPG